MSVDYRLAALLFLTAAACGHKTCEADDDCRGGFACLGGDSGGVSGCALSCTTHHECADAFVCDFVSGACVESDWCTTDAPCAPYLCAPRDTTDRCAGPSCEVDESTGCYTGCGPGCAEGYRCSIDLSYLCNP